MSVEAQTAMFGTTLDQMDSDIAKQVKINIHGSDHANKTMMAMSIMSDAQEEISRSMQETARQSINRAKYILSQVV